MHINKIHHYLSTWYLKTRVTNQKQNYFFAIDVIGQNEIQVKMVDA